MSPELVSTIAVGVALAGLILTGLHGLRVELNDVRAEVADLRERVARLEGLFEGFIKMFEGFIQKTPSDEPGSN